MRNCPPKTVSFCPCSCAPRLPARRSPRSPLTGPGLAQREADRSIQLPGTGSLKADIDAIIAAFPEHDPHAGHHYAMLLGLANAASHDQALRDAFSKHVLGRPRRLIRQLLERAMSRGEIPAGRDLDLIANTLIGLNLLRLAEGKPIDREHVSHVLRDVLYPLAITRPDS